MPAGHSIPGEYLPAWPALLPASDTVIPRPLRTAFLNLQNEVEKISSDALLAAVG